MQNNFLSFFGGRIILLITQIKYFNTKINQNIA